MAKATGSIPVGSTNQPWRLERRPCPWAKGNRFDPGRVHQPAMAPGAPTVPMGERQPVRSRLGSTNQPWRLERRPCPWAKGNRFDPGRVHQRGQQRCRATRSCASDMSYVVDFKLLTPDGEYRDPSREVFIHMWLRPLSQNSYWCAFIGTPSPFCNGGPRPCVSQLPLVQEAVVIEDTARVRFGPLSEEAR